MIIKKKPLLLNLIYTNKYDLRLRFSCIFHYTRKNLVFIQPHDLNLIRSAIISFFQSEL